MNEDRCAIFASFVADATSTQTSTGQPSGRGNSFIGLYRHIVAVMLSAFFPGFGQLIIGQRRKGITLLILFMFAISCVCVLRLPRFFAGFIGIIVCWLILSFYGSASALFALVRQRGFSKLWYFVIPILVFAGFNLTFTPTLLLSGFRAMKFGSSAMQPTLWKGELFLSDVRYFHDRSPARNDLVLMKRENYATVKRIIAIGGDTIEGKKRQVSVDGILADEPFIEHSRLLGAVPENDSFGPITVPPGKLFVMGDNRDVSLDSRSPEFGVVDPRAVVGKPLYIYRSPKRNRVGHSLN